MSLFGMFKKKAGAANVELKKIENRDLMQAIVGVLVLVAYADGECSKDELTKAERLIRANEQLQHFGSEITTTMGRFVEFMEAGARLGELKIMREVAEIKANQADAQEVFVNAITIAEAEGGIDDKERAMLVKIGRELGLRLQDFGLEG